MIRLLTVSPYPTVRAGLRAIAEASGDMQVVSELGGGLALELAWDDPPDVALVDHDARDVVELLERRLPGLAMVILGGDAQDLRRNGTAPRGYLRRDAGPEEILAAIRAVAAGLSVIDPALARVAAPESVGTRGASDDPLTPRELEVLQLVASGLPNKTIASRLGISEHTAKFHVSAVLSKLGASSRTEAVTTAAQRGLLML